MYNTCHMANIKSAIKRISVTKTKNTQNRPVKTQISNEIKKFKEALAAKELKHAESQLNVVFSVLDAAAVDNVIHKNKANRQKAKLAAALNKAQNAKTKKSA